MFCHGADALGHPGIPLKVWTFKSSWGQEKWTVVLGLHRAAFTSNKAQEGEAGGGEHRSLQFLGFLPLLIASYVFLHTTFA